MKKKFLISTLINSIFIFLFYSCQKIISPIAGNFNHHPQAISANLGQEAKDLINKSFAGINLSCLRDFHVHAIGVGANDSGIYVNPEMLSPFHPWKYLQYQVYISASGVRDLKNLDDQYIERLIQLIQTEPRYGKVHLLAFDYHYDKNGKKNLDRSTFYIPNEYVFKVAQKFPDLIIPVISVHPDRPGSSKEIEKWGKKGVKFIKWLPNAQRINPSSTKHHDYYKMVKKYNMAILSHTGHEKAVDGEEFQALGNPLLFKYPLEMGVKIIMAHLASLGKCKDFEHPQKKDASCFDLFLRMFENPKYKNNLFGEISGVTIYTRVGAPLLKLLERPELHERLINGSDYPLPAINILYRTSLFSKLGYITKKEEKLINEIYKYNPLLFDFVLKRALKHPTTGQKFLSSAFEIPKGVGTCQTN